jgi:subtilisin-like proprotein convertase family protein
MNLRFALSAILAGCLAVSCAGSSSLTGPTGSEKDAAASVDGAATAASVPNSVFKINPPADATGTVSGRSPFEVTFNNCQTTDPDGDALSFKYDFLGNGSFERGRCRSSHVYEVSSGQACYRPVVCTKDGGPDGTDCKTWSVCVTGKATETPAAAVGTANFESSDVPLFLPDVATVESSVVVAGVAGPIQNLTIDLHLTHTFDADLDIFLIGPDGTTIQLSTDNGGSANNFGTGCGGRTTFDDAAPVSITAGVAPFAGTFRPENPLSTFAGKSANGTWRLRITDDLGGDVGTLSCWSLTITG